MKKENFCRYDFTLGLIGRQPVSSIQAPVIVVVVVSCWVVVVVFFVVVFRWLLGCCCCFVFILVAVATVGGGGGRVFLIFSLNAMSVLIVISLL